MMKRAFLSFRSAVEESRLGRWPGWPLSRRDSSTKLSRRRHSMTAAALPDEL